MTQATYFSILATIFIARALPRWACFIGATAYTVLSIVKGGWFA